MVVVLLIELLLRKNDCVESVTGLPICNNLVFPFLFKQTYKMFKPTMLRVMIKHDAYKLSLPFGIPDTLEELERAVK